MDRRTILGKIGAAIGIAAGAKAVIETPEYVEAAPESRCQLNCWANSGTKYCKSGDLYVYRCLYPCCDKSRTPLECKWVVKYGVCG